MGGGDPRSSFVENLCSQMNRDALGNFHSVSERGRRVREQAGSGGSAAAVADGRRCTARAKTPDRSALDIRNLYI